MNNFKVGTPIKPSGWDRAARGYSLMTLMEVNGTNQQLDCLPLSPDMVVLDCGCGPGRVSIQLAKRVKKVIALDSSLGMLTECRRNCAAAGITNVEFVYADWQETEIGNTIPEVDMVIQSRGGGGHSSLAMIQKAARQYYGHIIWAKGAPNLPESKGKLFADCFSEDVMEKIPSLKPFDRRAISERPVDMPPHPRSWREEAAEAGIEVHVTTIDEGWDRQYVSKEQAYADLLVLTEYPEYVDLEQFRKNVDQFLTEKDGGWYFFLPTRTDISWFKTR